MTEQSPTWTWVTADGYSNPVTPSSLDAQTSAERNGDQP
jgi:hypothetical protein